MSYRSEYLAKAMQPGGMGFDYAFHNSMRKYSAGSYQSSSYNGNPNYQKLNKNYSN